MARHNLYSSCIRLTVLLFGFILFTSCAFGTLTDESIIEQQQRELLELNYLVEYLSDRIERTEKENTAYSERLSDAENVIEHLTRQNEVHRRAASDSQVAFYAKLTGSLHGLSAHDTIVSNTSAVYDTSTGIFTPPVTGMYVISWTANVNHREYQSTELMVGDQVKGSAFADTAGTGEGDYGSASQTVVLQVAKDSHVFIRTGTAGDGSIHGADYSTFSGFLLFPINED